MILRNSKWYVQYFFWCCTVMDRFTGPASYVGRRQKQAKFGTNLCQFFRTLLLGSLIAFVSLAVWLALLFTILIKPFLVVGFQSVAMFALAVCLIITVIAAVGGAIWGCIILKDKIDDALEERARRQTEPSLFGLAIIYLKAVKERYCPTISFTEETSND